MQDGREDDPVMETTAGAVDEPNAGAVLPPAMAVTAFGPGNDAHIDADHDITLTLMSQRPMMFQDSEVEIQDRVGALEMAVDDVVDYGLNVPRCCAISFFRTNLDVFRRALSTDPPARVDPMTASLQPGATAVRAKPRASPIVHIAGDYNC